MIEEIAYMHQNSQDINHKDVGLLMIEYDILLAIKMYQPESLHGA